ncbi:hypothetical protein E5288_WYG018554 [Bos mutus]|uniref:Lipocalin/cytosolic fatty-acid binding domain-containing protein n=1 Tax=Bos mutus TaxID=72004 RepID=A0A6B0S2D5_9CETA|nr:hypothetical protein [Bos mutus]
MKAVFLTLLLGLVCAAQETPAETEASEITGDWNTIYMAVDNKEKIEQGGPLRGYIRHFECINNCEQLSVTFYVKPPHGVTAKSRYFVWYYMCIGGGWGLCLIPKNDKRKGDSLTEEDFQRYEELNSERGIPNENIDDATKTDNCPK